MTWQKIYPAESNQKPPAQRDAVSLTSLDPHPVPAGARHSVGPPPYWFQLVVFCLCGVAVMGALAGMSYFAIKYYSSNAPKNDASDEINSVPWTTTLPTVTSAARSLPQTSTTTVSSSPTTTPINTTTTPTITTPTTTSTSTTPTTTTPTTTTPTTTTPTTTKPTTTTTTAGCSAYNTCDTTPYCEDNQMCCSKVVQPMLSAEYRCCKTTSFDRGPNMCCSGIVNVRFPNPKCCGPVSFDKDTHQCSSGNVIPL